MELFTIGHSNHNIETFIELLQQHQITAVADVRSHPYSRRFPQFNQSELQTALKQVNIRYVFLGRELGARAEDLSCYDSMGKAVYERIAATGSFTEGIQRILNGVKTHRIALMCAEKDPMTCHRSILVCRNLRQSGLTINHILSEGQLESQAELENRLLAKFNQKINPPQEAVQLLLFEPNPPQQEKTEINLEEAYHKQGYEIAYTKKDKQK
ncbi:MAG: DUF488 domain-containing protein [Lyngbya sp.]|nr:DUF488 domain-containing protein [Lyngbya sp.]